MPSRDAPAEQPTTRSAAPARRRTEHPDQQAAGLPRLPTGSQADRRLSLVKRHAGGRAVETAELCLQVIKARARCGLDARSCDDRWIRRPIGRNVRPPAGIRHYFLVTEGEELPGSVRAAYERASSAGFQLACEVEVGRVLAALAAAVPGGGRVLEIGTGVGLAWLVHGLGARRDVEVVTVELDDEVQRTALSAPWPPWVRFESGDGADAVGGLGQFDLIFPDAPGGKIFELRRTVAQQAEMMASGNMSSEMQAASRSAISARGFELEARRMAGLMRDKFNLAFIDVGGWDTHVNEGAAQGQLANLLGNLGQGLSGFAQQMGSSWSSTVVVVISEFGRTVRQNGNGGTDHGHGNVMWVMGGPVRGRKVYGAWPGLSTQQLYQERDLAVTTDFREPIAAVLRAHMGLGETQIERVFPGRPSPTGRTASLIAV